MTGEIDFRYINDGVIAAERDGVPVAILVRKQGTWDLMADGAVLATGMRTQMKRLAVERFCRCHECEQDGTKG